MEKKAQRQYPCTMLVSNDPDLPAHYWEKRLIICKVNGLYIAAHHNITSPSEILEGEDFYTFAYAKDTPTFNKN